VSGRDVEIIRRGFEAFNRGDREAWLELCEPDFETVPSPDWPEQDAIRGRVAAWDFFAAVNEAWEGSPYEPVEVVDVGDGRVIVRLRREMRGKASGAAVIYDYWLVATVREGRAARIDWFETGSQAFAAAGLDPPT
jgi:ketosteroid isomerase-like protein